MGLGILLAIFGSHPRSDMVAGRVRELEGAALLAGPGVRQGRARWADTRRKWVYGNAGQRKALRTRLLEVNPFCWLVVSRPVQACGVWMVLGFVVCWWLYMRVVVHLPWAEESFSLTTAFDLDSVLKLWIGIEACQRLAEEQKIGSLELLLSTPLSERGILRGQFLALKRQFLKPLAVVIGVEMVFMLAVSRPSSSPPERVPGRLAFGLAGIVLLVSGHHGPNLGRSPGRGDRQEPESRERQRDLARSGLALDNLRGDSGHRGPLDGWRPGPSWKFFLYLWFWLGVFADVAFGLPAWWQLRTRFRELALQRFTTSREKPV